MIHLIGYRLCLYVQRLLLFWMFIMFRPKVCDICWSSGSKPGRQENVLSINAIKTILCWTSPINILNLPAVEQTDLYCVWKTLKIYFNFFFWLLSRWLKTQWLSRGCHGETQSEAQNSNYSKLKQFPNTPLLRAAWCSCRTRPKLTQNIKVSWRKATTWFRNA